MTTGPTSTNDGLADRDDAIILPLSFLLWTLVAIALAYGVISTLSKVVQLFG